MRGAKELVKIAWKRAEISVLTGMKIKRNRRKERRRLEIGPGRKRIPGFETMDIVPGYQVDYVVEVNKPLPFEKETFEIVHASHVLEHVPWYYAEETMREWARIVTSEGYLEIWIPDGLKIAEKIIESEEKEKAEIPDGWRERNPEGEIHKWISGRIFWGGHEKEESWHKAIYTEASLRKMMKRCGLQQIERLGRNKVRGRDHGWINLGMRGRKP
jgi:predicted SAM-dependent methyltransferase